MAEHIFGRDLRAGQLIETWSPGNAERVLKIEDFREQILNGVTYRLATAYCTNSYNITVFLDRKDVRLA